MGHRDRFTGTPARVLVALVVIGPVALAAPVDARTPVLQVRLVASMPDVTPSASIWRVLAAIRDTDGPSRDVTIDVTAEGARVLSVQPAVATVSPERDGVFFVTLRAEGSRPGRVTVRCGGAGATADLPLGIDLLCDPWDAWYAGPGTWAASVTGPPTDVEWLPRRLPEIWEDLGITWVRKSVVIPEGWRGRELTLSIRAVDDNDITFLNGQRIGATSGWDVQRTYPLPPDLVRWGEPNEIHIAVENGNAGGGIAWAPVWISAGTAGGIPAAMFPEAVPMKESERAQPGPVGRPLPLRPMRVHRGVLSYEDGGEVALWGVNCYPQSWVQYQTLKMLGVDHRRAVDEDIGDLEALGIEIIRIHVFDTEISDAQGNLVHNDHLDILDYLVAQCVEKGIYLMLTPMAWWGSPGQRADAFSVNTPKEAMSLWEAGWPVQQNYLRQFLSHTNAYTGQPLVDEPAVALFEIINEPTYWDFADVQDAGASAHPSLLAVRQAWDRFCPDASWQTPATFAYFRYDLVRRYINTMVDTMRAAGAYQPIAYSSWTWQGTDLGSAVGDSRCDAVTMSMYPGGLRTISDDRNMLGSTANGTLDSRFADKARLVYEFDADGTVKQACMYPAIARHWRNLGVQVACQFQYDSRAAAHLNVDWPPHYLNAYHTPAKMVSFAIGGEVFRRLPRGAEFETPPDDQVFGPAAVSFAHNVSLLCAPDAYMQSRPTDWHPLAEPRLPVHVLSVGSCRAFDYDGTGIVDLHLGDGVAELRVYPDVDRLREGWAGTVEEPLTRLVERTHSFRLKLPGWRNARALQRTDRGLEERGRAADFDATPGVYRIER